MDVRRRKHKSGLCPLWSMQHVWMFSEFASVKNGQKKLGGELFIWLILISFWLVFLCVIVKGLCEE